jgi:hypothetical protein
MRRAAFLFCAVIASNADARAEDMPSAAKQTSQEVLDPERYELAGFPIIGGNTDIGVQFGGAGTLTRFHDDVRPYRWNIDLLLSASIKSDSNGTRLVQQSHVLRLDAPNLFGGRVRIDTRGSFQRTVNAGYYGIGNDSSAAVPPGADGPGRRYQYLQQEGRVRAISRVKTGTFVDLALGANVRYESPSTYVASKLAEDAGPVLGTHPNGLAGLAIGAMVDTRDSEFVTRSGIFYQVGVGYTVGANEDVRYANTSAVLAHYAPLVGPFTFANRFVASFEDGRVPFYDLQQGGTFESQNLLGGESGVRGVPQGRYGGLVKVITNVEIRSTLPRFVVLKQRVRLGTTTFFDAGRVWSGYSLDPARDGLKLGLKYGVGAGAFLQWGEAAIFRIEVAYSPDAVAENPGFPVGIYVADGLMF